MSRPNKAWLIFVAQLLSVKKSGVVLMRSFPSIIGRLPELCQHCFITEFFTHTRVHACTHAHMHARTHTHTHTHTLTSEGVYVHVPLVEFMYLAFTCTPCESYHRRLGSLLCLFKVFQALSNSLVCWFFSHFFLSFFSFSFLCLPCIILIQPYL